MSTVRPGPRQGAALAFRRLARVPLGIVVLLVTTSLLLAAPRVHGTGVLAFFSAVRLTTAVLVGTRIAARHRERGP
ncbi:hypothetical protein ACWD4P_08500 [Kitasatospora sp. NPDC002543]